MLVTDKKDVNGTITVKLSGNIDETSHFNDMIGIPKKALRVYCKDVKSINSIGLKSWISYFRSLRASGIQLKFIECSPVIVAHVGMVYDVVNREELESVSVPFYCEDCKVSISEIYKMEDLKKIQFNLPEIKCPRCKSFAKFDELSEEYFKTLLG